MLGVPAKVAGCQEIIFASPPRKDGSVCPEVLYVAEKLGVKKVVVAGGAQAIFALAYGTESVPKVDKICGPGNQFVTAAKMMAQVFFRFLVLVLVLIARFFIVTILSVLLSHLLPSLTPKE